MARGDNISGLFRDTTGRLVSVMQDPVPARRAADYAGQLVRRRTRRGVDRHGQPFAPYAKSTRRRKSGVVNLSDTGLMLDRLSVRDATRGGSDGRGHRAELAFGTRRDERIARLHTSGTKRMPRRDFFGLSEREAVLVASAFGQEVRRRLIPTDRRRRVLLLVGSV